jgi:type III pantothenate kinase
MNLCIDQGNSSTKIGVFDQDKLIEFTTLEKLGSAEISKLFEKFPIDACILSSVISENDDILIELMNKCPDFIELSHFTPIPIENRYKTPETLGKDRLAAVVGASFLKPGSDILVVDAGTAITYDFIDANKIYWGGNIAPGLNLRLQALHEFTQKLPLVEAQVESPGLGTDTQSAIISGAMYGIVYEIDGYINHLKID